MAQCQIHGQTYFRNLRTKWQVPGLCRCLAREWKEVPPSPNMRQYSAGLHHEQEQNALRIKKTSPVWPPQPRESVPSLHRHPLVYLVYSLWALVHPIKVPHPHHAFSCHRAFAHVSFSAQISLYLPFCLTCFCLSLFQLKIYFYRKIFPPCSDPSTRLCS